MAKTLQLPRRPELQGLNTTGSVSKLQAPIFSGAASLAQSIQPYKFKPPKEVRYPFLKTPVDKVGSTLSPETLNQFTNTMLDVGAKLVDSWATRDAIKLSADLQDQYTNLLYDTEAGYYNLTGEEAVKAKSTIITQIDQLGSAALKSADPFVRAKAFEAVSNQQEKHKITVARYAANQDMAWKQASEKLAEKTFLVELDSTALDANISIAKIEQGIESIAHLRGDGALKIAQKHDLIERAIKRTIDQAYIQSGRSKSIVDDVLKGLQNNKWAYGYELDNSVIQKAIDSGEKRYYTNEQRIEKDEHRAEMKIYDAHERILEGYKDLNDKAGYKLHVESMSEHEKGLTYTLRGRHEAEEEEDTLPEKSVEYYDAMDALDRIDSKEGLNEFIKNVENTSYHKRDRAALKSAGRSKRNGQTIQNIDQVMRNFEYKISAFSPKSGLGMAHMMETGTKNFDNPQMQAAWKTHKSFETQFIRKEAQRLLLGGEDGKGALTVPQTIEKIQSKLKDFSGITLYSGTDLMYATDEELIGSMNQLELEFAQGMMGPEVLRHKTEEMRVHNITRNNLIRAGYVGFPAEAEPPQALIGEQVTGGTLEGGKVEKPEEVPTYKGGTAIDVAATALVKKSSRSGWEILKDTTTEFIDWRREFIDQTATPGSGETSDRIFNNAYEISIKKRLALNIPDEFSTPFLAMRESIEAAVDIEFGDNLQWDVKQQIIGEMMGEMITFDIKPEPYWGLHKISPDVYLDERTGLPVIQAVVGSKNRTREEKLKAFEKIGSSNE